MRAWIALKTACSEFRTVAKVLVGDAEAVELPILKKLYPNIPVTKLP